MNPCKTTDKTAIFEYANETFWRQFIRQGFYKLQGHKFHFLREVDMNGSVTYTLDTPNNFEDSQSEASLSVDDELRLLIEEDETRLGDVYRLHVLDGLSAREVADQLNVKTHGFVWSYKSRIDAILEGSIPTNASARQQALGAIRSILRTKGRGLSTEAVQLLTQHLENIQRATDVDRSEVSVEAQQSSDEYDTASLDGVEGIYAFSYGWYLEHPVDEDSGTTLIKVGFSRNIGSRIRAHQQAVKTHFPEPLAVIRAYSTRHDESRRIESVFHRLLKTAGHENPRYTPSRRREVGEEWFLTNEDFLDAIASALGLRTEYIGSSEFLDV